MKQPDFEGGFFSIAGMENNFAQGEGNAGRRDGDI
jgi:hypothetical protein